MFDGRCDNPEVTSGMDAVAGLLWTLGDGLIELGYSSDQSLAQFLVAVGGGPMPDDPGETLYEVLWLIGNAVSPKDFERWSDDGGRVHFFASLRTAFAIFFERMELEDRVLSSEVIERLRRDLVVRSLREEWEADHKRLNEYATKNNDKPFCEPKWWGRALAREEQAREAADRFLNTIAGGPLPDAPEEAVELLLWAIYSKRIVAADHRFFDWYDCYQEGVVDKEDAEKAAESRNAIERARADVFYADLRTALEVYFARVRKERPAEAIVV